MAKQLILVSILIGTMCGAQAQTTGFKGVPFGAKREQLLEKFPTLKCTVVSRSFRALGDELCEPDMMVSTPNELLSYGDRPAWGASFSIVAGKFERFSIRMRTTSYEAVRAALIEANGKGAESVRTMTTRGGASFSSRTWVGVTGRATYNVREHSGSIDEGEVSAESAEFEAFTKSLVDPKKGAKDI